MQEQFGLESSIYAASQQRRAQVLEVASVYLWHWLIRNNVFKYFNDQIDLIPQCVRASARNDILAFLAGLLDSDGWSGLTHETRAGRFTLSTSDKFFAQHLQDVSWAVGVPLGCSLNNTGANLQTRREMYLLTGCVYMVHDAFEVLLRNSTKLQTTASLPEFTRWEWQTEHKRNHIGKITELAPGNVVPTYDIEVEGNHWFYAGAVKSHNSSQLLDCSSGLHARWAPYYIRNVRVAATSPLFKVLRDAGVPMDPENGQTPEDAITWVIHFPMKSPDSAITRNDRSAVEQCEYWLQNKLYWTDHNPSCFTRETRFITDQGLRRFAEFGNGESVTVLNETGHWTEGTVRHFAAQEIWEVVVERCQMQHTIRTTANHLWPVTSPMHRLRGTSTRFVRTDELSKMAGSATYKLITVNPAEMVEMELEGVLHGIVFGDGTRHKPSEGRQQFCQIYLCNDPNGVDSRELAGLFAEAGYNLVEREDMEQVRIYGLPKHWKDLPALEMGPEYLRGFIAGWFAADGHIDQRGSNVFLSSAHREYLEWLQNVAPVAGIAVSTVIGTRQSESTFGPVTWYSIGLSKETLTPEFFLLERKRARFNTAHFKTYWKVVSAQPTGQYESVACVEVPEGQQFVLEGNILTHNCTITYHPDEIIDLMRWVWEHRNEIGGLSFLPSFDANYAQMPYMEIPKAEYERLVAAFPPIDFSKVYRYEDRDLTQAAMELACSSGRCEIDLL
ncbi:MAG: hypothetical protein HC876_11970 [Chloroflexaceae bacterium]|nr:hypothetical protein [Chloroflexaceae bacterium]